MRPWVPRRRIWATVVLLALAAPSFSPAAPAPVAWPQVRIDSVDASAFPRIRLLATVLDAKGRALPPKLLERVEVLSGAGRGRGKGQPPEVWFSAGKPMDGRKDAKLVPRDKSDQGLALAVVAAGYGEGMPASAQERLRESLQLAFKQLGKADRAGLLWYGDRIWQAVALAGYRSRLADVERLRGPCQQALEAARSGLPLPAELVGRLGKEDPPVAAGTNLCGLTADHKALGALAAQQAFSGAFPRLFNLGPGFFQPSRYCAVPPGQLDGFGELIADNYNRQMAERETMRAAGEALDWETSALDEALRLVLSDQPRGLPPRPESRAILLLSDGRDGYVRDLQLCQDNPPSACAAIDRQKERAAFGQCIQNALTQRMAQQQEWFRQKAQHWLGLARAGGVRIHAVGLGSLGAPHELERLRLLAERSGGTFRLAEDEPRLADVVARAVGELGGQLVLDYTAQGDDGPAEPPEEAAELTLRLSVTLARGLGQDGALLSAPVQVALAARKPLRERLQQRAEDSWLALEERVGRERLRIAVLIAGGAALLLLLLLTGLLVRRMVRRRVQRKGGKP